MVHHYLLDGIFFIFSEIFWSAEHLLNVEIIIREEFKFGLYKGGKFNIIIRYTVLYIVVRVILETIQLYRYYRLY